MLAMARPPLWLSLPEEIPITGLPFWFQQISMEALSLVEGQEEPGHQQRPVLPAGQ